jgi:hypothetical protein
LLFTSLPNDKERQSKTSSNFLKKKKQKREEKGKQKRE